MLAKSRQDPAKVGKPVQVTENFRIWIFECRDMPFRVAAGRSRKIEGSGNGGRTRYYPIFRIKRFVLFKIDNHRSDSVDHLCVGDFEPVLHVSLTIFRQGGELAHDNDQIFLDSEKDGFKVTDAQMVDRVTAVI